MRIERFVTTAAIDARASPLHRDSRAERRAFEIDAQSFTGLELTITHQPARLEPAQWRFGDGP
jgi:hypothetical protein